MVRESIRPIRLFRYLSAGGTEIRGLEICLILACLPVYSVLYVHACTDEFSVRVELEKASFFSTGKILEKSDMVHSIFCTTTYHFLFLFR